MVTYLVLFKWTQKGIENVKASPSRVDAVKKAFQQGGAQVKDFYFLFGPYDTMIMVDAPDDQTMARLGLWLSSQGNVRSETLRAFTEDEFRKLVAALP